MGNIMLTTICIILVSALDMGVNLRPPRAHPKKTLTAYHKAFSIENAFIYL